MSEYQKPQLISAQDMQPRIVSWEEIQRALEPLLAGQEWARKELHDLWEMGAPMPQAEGEPERRILLPTQFAQWWAEVGKRHGLSAPAGVGHELIKGHSHATAGPHRGP